jgi:hypothetical protein
LLCGKDLECAQRQTSAEKIMLFPRWVVRSQNFSSHKAHHWVSSLNTTRGPDLASEVWISRHNKYLK